MGTPAQVVPGYFVWQAPGQPVTVHLSLNVVDKLGAEVMSGFSVSSKRAPEIGGLLLGTISDDPQPAAGHPANIQPAIVKVESFLAVPCEYRRGPSYLFTEDDGAVFEKAFSQPGVIGYFRTHTRDGLALAAEDLEILEHFFPGSANVALLIKPFATIACAANFFIRDKGAFASDAALEFPFRRRELAPDGTPLEHSFEREPPRPPRPSANGSHDPSIEPAMEASGVQTSPKAPPKPAPNSPPKNAPKIESSAGASGEKTRFDPAEPAYAYTTPAKKPRLRRWYWIPLSFIFLLLGLFLGFQVALTVGSRVAGSKPDVSLNLSVVKNGANLNVRWDRESSIVRASQNGTLEIEDGAEKKRVELDYAQLHNGALIYRGSSSSVRFRLIVYPSDRVSVSESVEWK